MPECLSLPLFKKEEMQEVQKNGLNDYESQDGVVEASSWTEIGAPHQSRRDHFMDRPHQLNGQNHPRAQDLLSQGILRYLI